MGSVREHVCETALPARCVLLAECTVQVTHGRAHVLAWRIPRIARFVFFLCASDVMAARVGWSPAGGSKSLPDGSVHVGEA